MIGLLSRILEPPALFKRLLFLADAFVLAASSLRSHVQVSICLCLSLSLSPRLPRASSPLCFRLKTRIFDRSIFLPRASTEMFDGRLPPLDSQIIESNSSRPRNLCHPSLAPSVPFPLSTLVAPSSQRFHLRQSIANGGGPATEYPRSVSSRGRLRFQ